MGNEWGETLLTIHLLISHSMNQQEKLNLGLTAILMADTL